MNLCLCVYQISIGNNYLRGTIPSQLGLLKALETLLLDSNDLSGPLPSELGTLTKIKTIDMSKTFSIDLQSQHINLVTFF